MLTTNVSMPEATVHENYFPCLWENDVGSAREILAMKPKSKTQIMRTAADQKFRRCIPLAHARHQFGPSCFRNVLSLYHMDLDIRDKGRECLRMIYKCLSDNLSQSNRHGIAN